MTTQFFLYRWQAQRLAVSAENENEIIALTLVSTKYILNWTASVVLWAFRMHYRLFKKANFLRGWRKGVIFERKIFRRIYGLKYENGEWKSRTNRELGEMNKGENIVKWIKWQRISWLGHLEGLEDDRMPKKVFTQEVEGTRRSGRPRKRWK